MTTIGRKSLVDVLRSRAESTPDRVAYRFLEDGEDQQTELTWGGLHEDARAVAGALRNRSKPGDRVILIYPPGLDYLRGFFGALYAGLVPVPAYPPDPMRLNRTLPRLSGLITDAQSTLALTTSMITTMADTVTGLAPELKTVEWIASDTVSRADGSSVEIVSPKSDDLAFLQYTSGSTGNAKGVMITHGNLVAASEQWATLFQHDADSDIVSWLPIYHDLGLIGGLLQSCWVGSVMTFMSPLHFLQKPIRWLRAATKYRAHTTGSPNFGFDLVARKVKEAELATLDLSHLHAMGNSAERIRAETLDTFSRKFAPCGFRRETLILGYGLAEGTISVTGARSPEHRVERLDAKVLESERRAVTVPESQPGTTHVGCGSAVSEVTLRIVDHETGHAVGDGIIGEVCVHGPNVAKGYFARPDVTRDTFGFQVDGLGPFLRTGDVGYLRAGQLFVVGRIKDLIIINGKNVYPDDLERAAEAAHPAIRPGCSAAFAVDDGQREKIVLVAELDFRSSIPDATDVKPPRVSDAVQEAISERFQLRVDQIVLIRSGTLPKTSSGKVQRHACKQEFIANTLTRVEEGGL